MRQFAWDAIRRATVFFWQKLTEELNKSNPRPYRTPSKPGEPPRLRTGFLKKSVQYQLSEPDMRGTVGVDRNCKYAVFLEKGTAVMEARPFLSFCLKKYRTQVMRQLKDALKFGRGSQS